MRLLIAGLFLATLVVAQTAPKAPAGTVAPAQYTTSITAELPPEAASRGVVGDVIVSVKLGQDGRVLQSIVLKGPALLREAALKAVSQQRFQPHVSNGRAVQVVMDVIVRFPSI